MTSSSKHILEGKRSECSEGEKLGGGEDLGSSPAQMVIGSRPTRNIWASSSNTARAAVGRGKGLVTQLIELAQRERAEAPRRQSDFIQYNDRCDFSVCVYSALESP